MRSLAVATDFSPESRPAVDLALVLADRLGGADAPGASPPALDLLHVEWPATLRDDPDKERYELLPGLEEEFTGAKARTGLDHAAIYCTRVLSDVVPSRGILTHATQEGTEMLVATVPVPPGSEDCRSSRPPRSSSTWTPPTSSTTS